MQRGKGTPRSPGRWVVFFALFLLAVGVGCEIRSYLSRSKAEKLIRSAMEHQMPTAAIRATVDGYGEVERDEWVAFLRVLEEAGFAYTVVEEPTFNDHNPMTITIGATWELRLDFPAQKQEKVETVEGPGLPLNPFPKKSWVLLEYGEQPEVKVTGIQREGNRATVELSYSWSVRKEAAELLRRIEDLNMRVAQRAGEWKSLGLDNPLVRIELPEMAGDLKVTLELYDDGWRVTDLPTPWRAEVPSW